MFLREYFGEGLMNLSSSSPRGGGPRAVGGERDLGDFAAYLCPSGRGNEEPGDFKLVSAKAQGNWKRAFVVRSQPASCNVQM